MLHTVKFEYDAATALHAGQRDRQEDSVASDFPIGAGSGYAVLADGMGGHSSGDIASKIVVTEVFSELKMQMLETSGAEQNTATVLHDAALGANTCIGQYTMHHPETAGMGSTLLASVFADGLLYWVSVGDSPLYLFREGQLRQLNHDHSMGADLDQLVIQGKMDRHEANTHPDRNCLTSVLIGGEVPRIDCRAEPFRLMDGDIVISASDGLQFLNDDEIASVVRIHQERPSSEIAKSLLDRLHDLNDPDQDNISLCVVRANRTDTNRTNNSAVTQWTDASPTQRKRTDGTASSLGNVRVAGSNFR